METLLYTIVLVYGLVIGSFLNVCIYRIPKGENIAITRSHCMSCGHNIAWYDLIPVVSFLILRGRCRSCKTKLSIQYPLVEALNGICYLLIFLANGFCINSVILCLLTSALIVISVIDFRTYEIPVACNGFILVLGIIATAIDYKNLADHLIGLVCISGFLYLLYVLTKGKGIGGGDIKLMAAAGLVIGWVNIILAFFLGCILGSVIHVIRMKVSNEDHVLAMGPYLSMGIFIAALYGDNMIQAYLSMIGL